MLRKEFINTTPVSPSDGFGLSPFVFNGVKVGTVRWKKLCLTLIGADRFQHIITLVKAGIVHHNHRPCWCFGSQFLNEPGIKNIRINAAIKQGNPESRNNMFPFSNSHASWASPEQTRFHPDKRWGCLPVDRPLFFVGS